MLGKHATPLGQIDLPVTFGTPINFRRETLTFEVVGFQGAYHAVLGRPCYVKFMAIPIYTYLKLKMPRPKGSSPWAPPYSVRTSARPRTMSLHQPFSYPKSS